MWWKSFIRLMQHRLRSLQKRDEESQGMLEEKYLIAKCIGCGQCQQGCPVKVKLRIRKKP